MTMEQQVRIYSFSNFIVAILVGFLMLILTVTQASNTANLTSVMTSYIILMMFVEITFFFSFCQSTILLVMWLVSDLEGCVVFLMVRIH